MILVPDRGGEEGHDTVAGELIDRALESVHALGEDLEEVVEDLMPLFRVEQLGQLHRPLHVGEKPRHLLPLAFKRASRCEDLLGEALRRVGARVL
jgi:hypothetical protein